MSKVRQKRPAHLYARLCEPGFLAQAWRRVREHYAEGALPAQLAEFERRRGARLDALGAQLRDQVFLPQPASLIYIPKPNHPGEQRPISLLQPEDRIVLTALNTLLSPLVERVLQPGCVAYRPQKGANLAIGEVTRQLRAGFMFVATGDVDDFFASIDRERLLALLRRLVWETPLLNLMEAYLHIGTSNRALEWADSGRGIAQGSPLSPVLSNLYLAEFDRHLQGSGLPWLRYADNIVVLGREMARLEEVWVKAVEYLGSERGLRLNAESVALTPITTGFEFLGFWFQGVPAAGGKALQIQATMAAARLEQKRASLNLALRQNVTELPRLVAELSETMLGWRNYYGTVPTTGPQLELLEKHLEDLLVPWLRRFRGGAGANLAAAELKAALARLELPVLTDTRKKVKWIELLLSRSKPVAVKRTDEGLSPLAAKALHERKAQLKERRELLEEILVTKPGTYLGRTGERLVIRRDGKREAEIPFSLIRNITFLTTAISLSGEFMVETAARGIPILLAGPDGRPAVRIGPVDLPGHELSLAQSALASSPAALELARVIVAGKIRNQVNLLQYFLKYPERRAGTADFLGITTGAIAEMERAGESAAERVFSADHELERNRLFATEAQAAVCYWTAVRALLWWKPGFDKRVHRGAGDLVNSLLNYGYGILYSRLLMVLLKTGLNVNIGFLHKPQAGKAGLLYDFIEEFRAAAVDRTVFSLLNLATELKMNEHGLDSETRHLLARKVLERLQAKTRYHGESLPLQKVMELQAQRLVRHIEGKEPYKCYVLPW